MDWKEVYEPGDQAVIRRQAGRCMDCGIPFCHKGCPLGNLIPEWNDLTWRGEGRAAIERLHATNNFPEFTGRLCPAPCESSCVLGINQPAVTIKQVEVSIIDEAFSNGWVEPEPPERLTGKTVAVVGSGPAGLAAAQQLTRAGHTVAVYERDDRIGGLLRYGIPDFKMEKRHLELRLRQMQAEGTRFRAGVEIGTDISWSDLRARYDAVVVATGSTVPRDLSIPGRDLDGVHFAMEYLVEGNKAVAGDQVPQQITAHGKHVVVIGGGDTGADCIGTAHRQGALSVTNLAIGKQPPSERPMDQPWPMMPNLFEMASAHEEGGERTFLASTVEFLGNDAGEVRALRVAETEYVDGRRVPKSGTEREIPADLVLIAMGFTGPERENLEQQLGAQFTSRGNVERDATYATTAPGVFVAGDAGRGQSLIVWAIAEGRAAAAEVDTFLMGETVLPAPVRPTDVAIGLLPA
jgi:glutamate synthase (NADPH/NADH) small chain